MESQPPNTEFRNNPMFNKTYKQIFFSSFIVLILVWFKTKKQTDAVKHTPYNSNVQSEDREN